MDLRKVKPSDRVKDRTGRSILAGTRFFRDRVREEIGNAYYKAKREAVGRKLDELLASNEKIFKEGNSNTHDHDSHQEDRSGNRRKSSGAVPVRAAPPIDDDERERTRRRILKTVRAVGRKMPILAGNDR